MTAIGYIVLDIVGASDGDNSASSMLIGQPMLVVLNANQNSPITESYGND